MANPQLENGYTSIANEILEALARTQIPTEARQVFDVLLRKIYGFHKKSDHVAISQIMISTGLRDTSVCRGINRLKLMGMIMRDARGNTQIQKDFTKWKVINISRRGDLSASITATLRVERENTLRVERYKRKKEIYTKERGGAVDKKTETGKPYIDGDRAFFDSETGRWRVKTHAGHWVDYVGDLTKLEYR